MSGAIRSSRAPASARRWTERRSAFRFCWPALLLLLVLARFAAAASSSLPDSTRADSLRSPTPRSALIRSAVLPGWGQYYNKKPLKALFFAATSASLLGSVVAEQNSLNDARSPQEHEDRAARRNTRLLLFVLSVTFSAIDAYVDTHLSDFAAAEKAVSLDLRPGGALFCLKVLVYRV